MTVILGSKYAQNFKSGIIFNGAVSLPAIISGSDIPQWATVEALNTDCLSKLTPKDFSTMYELSPISQHIKIPCLQFLGAKDRRAPYRQGLLLDAITKMSGGNMKTYIYEDSSHNLDDSVETEVDVAFKAVTFFIEN